MNSRNRKKLIIIIVAALACIISLVFAVLHMIAGKTHNRDPNVDIDISTLSSTAIYSEVSNMMTSPQKYEGKKIKVKGYYVVSIDVETGERFKYCLIPDAAQCCQQGMLFELKDGEQDKLPEENEEFTISGIFKLRTLPEDKNAQYVVLEKTKIYPAGKSKPKSLKRSN